MQILKAIAQESKHHDCGQRDARSALGILRVLPIPLIKVRRTTLTEESPAVRLQPHSIFLRILIESCARSLYRTGGPYLYRPLV